MRHLNYFFPYDKGNPKHEDHLTRAFLVLLKHSKIILQYFYDYVYCQLSLSDALKPLHQISFNEVEIETQVGSLPEADTYVSILITNEKCTIEQEIYPVERKAVYDGVINFNSELVFFIENKPNKEKIWEGQLCPRKEDIPYDATLIKIPAVLEWKEVLDILHTINENNFSTHHDKVLIGDFFEFINKTFDNLNPYNDFSKCHSTYLANKRSEQILKEIVLNPDKVKYHSGWGYYIDLNFPEVQKVGLIIHKDDQGNWQGINIAAGFGATVIQARAFYSKINSVSEITRLSDFELICDFHLAIQSQNMVFFKSPENSFITYFNYWKDTGSPKFGRVFREELLEKYLNTFAAAGIINFPQEKITEVNDKILNKRYQWINVCPGIYLQHKISRADAERLDKAGTLNAYIIQKMKTLLGILGNPLNPIFK